MVNVTTLSAREHEVLALVAERQTNTQIAQPLELSSSTVQAYLASALSKLGAVNRRDDVALATQQGLIPVADDTLCTNPVERRSRRRGVARALSGPLLRVFDSETRNIAESRR